MRHCMSLNTVWMLGLTVEEQLEMRSYRVTCSALRYGEYSDVCDMWSMIQNNFRYCKLYRGLKDIFLSFTSFPQKSGNECLIHLPDQSQFLVSLSFLQAVDHNIHKCLLEVLPLLCQVILSSKGEKIALQSMNCLIFM